MTEEEIYRDVFITTLQKIYWIEVQMEQLALWESMIESDEMAKKTIYKLMHDSEIHKKLLDEWLGKLNIKAPSSKPPGFPEKTFNFNEKHLPEIFKEIMKYELLVKGLYESILGPENEVLLNGFITNESERTKFITVIRGLVSAEKEHADICLTNIGSFRRIMGK